MGFTYLIIFLLAAIPFFEVAAIIPIAIIGGVPAIPTMITAFLGNLLTIVLLILFVDKIKAWQKKRKQKKSGNEVNESEASNSKRHKRARNIWGKYGLPGLAFIGPFFVGSHLSALLALSFGGTRNKTLILMTASLITWSIILGVAAHFGFDYMIADEEDLGFITKLLQ